MAKFLAMPTLHPAAIARDQNFFPVCVNDLRKGLEEPPQYHSPFPSVEEVKAFKFKKFSMDIETPEYRRLGDAAPVEMIGICGRVGFALCVPVTPPYIPELRRIFCEAEEIITHNGLAFDMPKVCKALDIKWEHTT